MKEEDTETSKDIKPEKRKHDNFAKSFLIQPIVAKEFLQEYLPTELKGKIDIDSVKVEKETFIEKPLRNRSSDVIYSCKTNDGEELYCYVLLENQSSNDQSMPFRLLRYTLLLLEKYTSKKKQANLPLVAPFVIYNGKDKYNSPRSLWEMFKEPELAKKLLGDEYSLIDLNAMPDEEIQKDKHIAMMQFMLKHAYERDQLNIIRKLFEKIDHKILLLDQENDFIYLKTILSYTSGKIKSDQESELDHIIHKKFDNEEANKLMYSLADKWVDDRIASKRDHWIGTGIEQGIEQGREQDAIKMIADGMPLESISKYTDIPVSRLITIRESL
jgi:predicted transposase/invertase (TIGR01784 family)